MALFLRRGLAVATLLSMNAAGCSPAVHSFRTAQVCLKNGEGRSLFRNELAAIAGSEKMRFVDSSDQTTAGFKELGDHDHPVLHIGVLKPDGEGLVASNLGLPENQVVIGFAEGSHPPAGHRFADLVVERLKQHWRVETVEDSGVDAPLDNCP